MSSKILVINGGSSSIKFQLMEAENYNVLASGICERIFVDGRFVCKWNGEKVQIDTPMPDHKTAFNFMVNFFIEHNVIQNKDEIKGLGHRIVHGGATMDEAKVIDKHIEDVIQDCAKFAPLHNEPELIVIRAAKEIFANAVHVSAFDTSFHTTIPNINKRYAIPSEWEEKYGVIRYGAHGTSHKYITQQMQEILNKKQVNIIVCHLGNGASVCAVKDSKSYNVSMGLTPLEGLIMGTRSGDIDPSVVEYITKCTGKSVGEITSDLNRKSGMFALCGYSDFRDVFDHIDEPKVREAADIYCKRIANYLVRYLNDLDNNCDAIVFTAGIGENCPEVREISCDMVKIIDLKIDKNINKNTFEKGTKISKNDSKIPVYVVPTNEELMIAQEVKRYM